MYNFRIPKIPFFIFFLTFLLNEGCSSKEEPQTPTPISEDNQIDVVYQEDKTSFVNPERGFYYPYTYYFKQGAIPSPLNVNMLQVNRSVNRSLVLTEYYLNDFINVPISQAALNMIQENMSVLRNGGCKCVLRFAYNDSSKASDKPWDASESLVLNHIEQLTPILQEYADVIYVLQAGFVGVWGEWYYTDHFIQEPKTKEEFAPRRRLLDKLLKALPKNRQIEIRTPEFLMGCFDLSAADSITLKNAYDGSDRSRIAGHNDCFLATTNDMGTFKSQEERQLWMNDTKYTIMGGETCGSSAYCKCPNTLSDMQKYHWSYLNSAYHPDVLRGWRENFCFDEIEQRLGYRYVLTNLKITKEIKANQKVVGKLHIRNNGFSNIINERYSELILTNINGSIIEKYPLKEDPRFWFSDQTHIINFEFIAPSSLEKNKLYILWLNLPDISSHLRENPDFSVRLANKDCWDSSTGYNKIYDFKAY